MNIFKKFITIFIVLFLFAHSLYGEDKIVYLDLDNVVINTNAGKSILDQLEKSKKSTYNQRRKERFHNTQKSRKQKKSSVSAREIKEYAEKNNSVRISYHEKVCAERMKTLFKAIDEMRLDIKNLRADMNKGKGAEKLRPSMRKHMVKHKQSRTPHPPKKT